MEKENLLTERDLLVLTACTSIMFIKDFEKVGKFIEETLKESLMPHQLALQGTFDQCRALLQDEYIKIIDKMIAQTKETKIETVSNTNEDDTWFHPFKD